MYMSVITATGMQLSQRISTGCGTRKFPCREAAAIRKATWVATQKNGSEECRGHHSDKEPLSATTLFSKGVTSNWTLQPRAPNHLCTGVKRPRQAVDK